MMDVLIQYLELLFSLFQYDINTLSNPWMYYPLCIPAFFYCGFMIIKWLILTLPTWIGPMLVAGAFRFGGDSYNERKCEDCKCTK